MASQNPHQTRKTRETGHNGETHFKANELLRDTLEEIKDRSEDAKNFVTEYVKEQPLKALGMALAAGVVLTLFLKR